MKIKTFKSSGSPEYAVREARQSIRILHSYGYEAVKVKIKETNSFWDGYGEYTLNVYFELKRKPVLRKIISVYQFESEMWTRRELRRKANNKYVDIDICECNSFWGGKEISGVVLF